MPARRVVYWNNIPSPYMVERFDAIAACTDLDFTAWFDAERESDRSWDVTPSEWQFKAQYLPAATRPRLAEVARQLREQRPDVLVTLHASPAFAAGIGIAKVLGIKVVLRLLKTFETWQPRSRVREAAKHAIFRSVDGFHVPGPDAAQYALTYGARPERIFSFPEPVDVQHFALGAEAARTDAAAQRAALSLRGCVFLYVGRLWHGKGIDYMIEAYRRLVADDREASLVLLGDGPDEARYRQMTASLPNVTFGGFVQKPELPRWLGLSDVLVFPTLGDPYGHVVQEAMAASLPVISTESAGDIHTRISEGLTGYVVPPQDSSALYERMATLAVQPALRLQMGAAGYEIMRHRTVEWWAGEFENMINDICRGRAKQPVKAAA